MSQYNDSNSMEGIFKLAWNDENLNGKSNIIVPQIDDSFKGKAQIQSHPFNSMEGIFQIKTYPRQRMYFNCTQDTFVNESIPSLNYGSYPYIKIGTDMDGKRYRSFVQFDISKLPTNIHVTKAQLILYSQAIVGFENIEIDLPDRSWYENSITWNGHPSRKQLLSVQQFPDGNNVCVLDVKSAVNEWIDNQQENYGLLLKAYDETIKKTITFLSKDYTTENDKSPILMVEYFDTNAYVPPNDFINGQSDIISAKTNSDILHGTAIINKDIMKRFIAGKSWIVRDDIVVGQSNILVNDNNFKGKAKIHIENEDLKGNADIIDILPPDDSLSGIARISRDYIYGKSEIQAISKIYGQGYIRALSQIKGITNVLVKNDSLKGISKIHFENEDIKGKSNIAILNDLLKGTSKIHFENEDVKGTTIISIDTIYGEAKIYIENEDLKGIANIIKPYEDHINGSSNIIALSQIKGISKIVYENVINGKAKIIYGSDIKGFSKIALWDDISGKSDINALSDIYGSGRISQTQISGKANVFQNSIIKGTFYIYNQKDLKGSAKIQYASRIDGTVSIEVPDFYDMQGISIIDGDETDDNLSYGFIM